MLIKCTRNNSALVSNWWKNNSSPLEDILNIGKYYTVYGIIFSKGVVYYELLSIHSRYTFSYPSFLFEVIDNRLSKEFCIGDIVTGDNEKVPFISFKEWINDVDFYSRLVDGENKEVEIFNMYVRQLDLEYATPDVKQYAIEIDGTWLQCCECMEAWEIEKRDSEMCICPNCKTILLNPFRI